MSVWEKMETGWTLMDVVCIVAILFVVGAAWGILAFK